MKNNLWQKVRGICILCVILIHCIPTPTIIQHFYINIIIRKLINFAVATFVFMSALFIKEEKIITFYKKKVLRLIPALLIWNVIYIMLNSHINGITTSTFIKQLITSGSCPHLYYIYVLIQLFILVPLIFLYLKKAKNKLLIYLPLIITPIYNLLILTVWVKFNKTIPLYNYFIFGWFTYFYLGILIKTKKIELRINLQKMIVLVLIAITLSILEGITVYYYANSYGIAASQLGFFNVFYSMLICCLLYKKSQDNNSKVNVLSKLGDYSFGIYLSHYLILVFVQKITSNLISSSYYTSIVTNFILTSIILYFVNSFYYEKIKGRFYGKSIRKK